MTIERILVPTDFDRASARAGRFAAELGNALGAKLTLVHVYALGELAEARLTTDHVVAIRARAQDALDAAVAELARSGCAVSGALRQGEAEDEVLAAASDAFADLIVMGTHGRRGLSRIVLGSVAEHTVRLSPVPVVTLAPWSFEDRADAGARLGERLAKLRPEVPTVLAIARAAVPIAVEIARALGCVADVLLVEPLEAPSGAIVGAIAEDGATVVADDARAVADDVTRAARRRLASRLQALRGARSLPDLTRRTIVLACDALTPAPPIALAAAVLRRMGAARVVLATPASARAVIEAVARDVDVECLETIEETTDASLVYRDAAEPSDEEAADLLHAVAGGEAAHAR